MKHAMFAMGVVVLCGSFAIASAQDTSLEAALEKYDRAFRTKDVETIKGLLASDVLLYEHSVRNEGLEDVFENHLKPEIVEFEEMKLELSDVRITGSGETAVVTRQYRIQGTLRGREINATGNETMGWKKVGGEWLVFHIHYSHPCPRPPAPTR